MYAIGVQMARASKEIVQKCIPEAYKVALTARIKDARRLSGLVTQKAFAKAVGVTRETLGKYETKEDSVTLDALRAISSASGQSLAWFFLEDGESIVSEKEEEPQEVDPLEALEIVRRALLSRSGSDTPGDQAGDGGGGAPNRSPDIDPPGGRTPGRQRPRTGQTKTQPAAGRPGGGRKKIPPPGEAESI